MPSIPSIDFNVYAANGLPSNKRLPRFTLWILALIYPLVWLWNVFAMYINGSVDAYYDPATTYAAGQWVRTLTGVYSSVQGGNTGHDVTDTIWWYQISPSFIGAIERAKYNARYLTLTYALNNQFGTTFRQPPYPDDPYVTGGAFSQIYVSKTVPSFVSLALGAMPQTLGALGAVPSIIGVATVPIIATASSYSFTIHVPTAIYTALGATNAIRDSKITRFVNNYLPGGLTFVIVQY